MEARAATFLDKGAAHVIRQLHPFISDNAVLVKAYDNSFNAEACRKGADFVPFQDDELATLRAIDEGHNLPKWVPPPVVRPLFWFLLETPMGFTQEEGSTSTSPVEIPEETKAAQVILDSTLAEPAPEG